MSQGYPTPDIVILRTICTRIRYRYRHEILCCVLCKKRSFSKNLTYFFMVQFHVKTGEKITVFLLISLASKMRVTVVFWVKSGIKLWNRHNGSGKNNEADGTRRKKKWNWRHAAEKNETDGTWLRRGRQFHFFFRPTLDGFIRKLPLFFLCVLSFSWNWQ